MILILMGVTGSGKTTIGRLLAQSITGTFADGDDFHPEANKEKMASGVPLSDDDRKPWLERLNELLRQWSEAGTSGVLACSALKAKYRELLLRGLSGAPVAFVLLEGSRAMLTKRLAARREHFMNPTLLDSQFATLEDPGDAVLHVCNDGTPEDAVAKILAHFDLAQPSS